VLGGFADEEGEVAGEVHRRGAGPA